MSVAEVEKLLGDYAELFNVYEENGAVIAKPKNKIDAEDFKRIAKTLRQIDGEYVRYDYSTKEGGYFKFKKEEAKSTATSEKKKLLVKDAVEYLDDIEKKVAIVKEKLKEMSS